jgi:hypothetical protein
MQLSPFTQYYARKLIQEYIESLRYALQSRIRLQDCTQINLHQILSHLYPTALEAKAKIDELEALVAVYRTLEVSSVENQHNLNKVKRRIIQLLGLRLGETLPTGSLRRIPEQWGTVFRFYTENQVREGFNYENEFYGLVQQFKPSQLLQIRQLTYVLLHHQIPFILTRSEKRYGIWIHMKSPAYFTFLKQGQHVVSLHLNLFKFKGAIAAEPILDEWVTRISA